LRVARFNVTLGATSCVRAVNRLLGELSMLFILAGKIPQKCSQLIHMRLVFVLASGLETRNPSQNRQEENEILFFWSQKNFLTKKRKRACPRENKKRVTGLHFFAHS
jgi:hypothetical protein